MTIIKSGVYEEVDARSKLDPEARTKAALLASYGGGIEGWDFNKSVDELLKGMTPEKWAEHRRRCVIAKPRI